MCTERHAVGQVAEAMWSEVEGASTGSLQLAAENQRGAAGKSMPRHVGSTADECLSTHTWLASNPVVSAQAPISFHPHPHFTLNGNVKGTNFRGLPTPVEHLHTWHHLRFSWQ